MHKIIALLLAPLTVTFLAKGVIELSVVAASASQHTHSISRYSFE